MPDPVAEPLRVPRQREYGRARGPVMARARWSAVRRRLARADYWWIASTRADGAAHVVAVLGVWIDDRLYWSMSPRTVTARGLLKRDAVAAHLPEPRRVAIVDGRARMLAPGDEHRKAAKAYRRRFGLRFDPSDREMRCYVLAPTVVRTWRSDDVRGTGLRWVFAPRA